MSRITANGANQFTDWVEITGSDYTVGIIPTSLVATVTVQAKRPADADAAAFEVKTFANGAMDVGQLERGQLGDGNWVVRAGIATGDFTSGSADIAVFA